MVVEVCWVDQALDTLRDNVKRGRKGLKFYLNGLLIELGGSLKNALGKWNSLSRGAVSLEMLAHGRRMRVASIAAENGAHEDTLGVDVLVLLSVGGV